MCLTCGCGDAHKEMGDANITYEDLKRAADSNDKTVAETIQIMQTTEDQDRRQHGAEYTGAGAR